MKTRLTPGATVVAAALLASACGGDSSSDGLSSARPSVTVSGLEGGQSVSAQLDGDEDEVLTFNEDRSRTFGTRLVSGTSYTVTITEMTGGAECAFAGGGDTFEGDNASGDNVRIRCGDEMDPPDEEDNGDDEEPVDEDEAVSAGNLDLIASSQDDPSFVTMAFRVRDPNNPDQVVSTPLADNQLEVTAGGHSVPFNPQPHEERLAYLETEPNIKRVLRVYVDVSSSMPHDAWDDIANALYDTFDEQETRSDHTFDRRMVFYWFDDIVWEVVTFVDDSGDPMNRFLSRMPPDGSAMPTTNVLSAVRNARDNNRFELNPMQLVLEDSVVITDGDHNTSDPDDGELQALRDSLEGERVSIIAYGENPDMDFLSSIISEDRIHTPDGLNDLRDILLGMVDMQDARAEGIHKAYAVLPEREGSESKELRLALSDTTLCPEGDCVVSYEYTPSAFSSNRGTYAMANKQDPYIGEKFRLVTFPWLNDWLDCDNAPVQWRVEVSEDQFENLNDIDGIEVLKDDVDYDIMAGSTETGTLTVQAYSGGSEDACTHDVSLNFQDLPERNQ